MKSQTNLNNKMMETMQTNNITLGPWQQRNAIDAYPEAEHSRFTRLWPGKILSIAPHIKMGIAYDQSDGEYTTRFKFWHDGQPLKDCYLNQNNQLDLSTSCGLIITCIKTTLINNSNRPYQTIIEITRSPMAIAQP